MSYSKVVSHVNTDGDVVYWLGPILSYEFALNCKEDGENIVTYLAKGSDIHNLNQPKLIIDTYESSARGDFVRHSKSWTNVTQRVTALGVIFEFDKNSMTEERVYIKRALGIVVIHYPSVQTLQSMMENADALRLVS